jgi:hypothetical protein
MLRNSPELFGRIPSDPTVSRLVMALASAEPKALRAIRTARATAREWTWKLAAPAPSGAGGGLIPVNLNAVIVLSQSEKEQATPTWKHTFGYHLMTTFIDPRSGQNWRGRPCAQSGLQRRRRPHHRRTAHPQPNAHLPTQTRHYPDRFRRRRPCPPQLSDPQTLSSTPSGEDIQAAILTLSKDRWGIAYDADWQSRHGAWVAELTGLLDLTSWPKGMRVIVRKERSHPGAQLRFTDIDSHRFTCFVTGTQPGGGRGQLSDLELRHRRRARCEDRIRTAKDTGLRNLPLHHFA